MKQRKHKAESSDSHILGSWLPKKGLRGTVVTGNFCMIPVALLFTVLFLGLDFMLPDSGSSPTVLEPGFLAKIGAVISSIFLGFFLSNWWAEWRMGDRKRLEATKMDHQVEEDIQRMSKQFEQEIHALNTLRGSRNDQEFKDLIDYIVGAQYSYIHGRIQEMALKIDELGYDSGAFIKEKRQRFSMMWRNVLALVEAMPAMPDTTRMMKVLRDSGNIQDTHSERTGDEPGAGTSARQAGEAIGNSRDPDELVKEAAGKAPSGEVSGKEEAPRKEPVDDARAPKPGPSGVTKPTRAFHPRQGAPPGGPDAR